jgi:hypothetical protein
MKKIVLVRLKWQFLRHGQGYVLDSRVNYEYKAKGGGMKDTVAYRRQVATESETPAFL